MLHTRADLGGHERRGAIKTLRSVEIASEQHGLHGVADVVELHGKPPIPYPVEYKRGRPKAHRADEVQLCAQALCLEEMFATEVSEGAIYYGMNRRRKRVAFDAALRTLTLGAAEETRSAISRAWVPPAHYEACKCDACSLFPLCRPKQMQAPPRIDTWLARAVASEAVPE